MTPTDKTGAVCDPVTVKWSIGMAQPGKSSASRRSNTSPARNSVRPPPWGAAEPAPSIVPERCNPDLVMLLDDPEVRLLMRADHVDEREMLKMLEAIRVQLRGNVQERPDVKDATSTAGQYRPGVGIMLLNERGEVFIGRRADVRHDAWQMPQGGIDGEETPQQAAMRELKEEIGTDNAEIIAESRGWLYYDVPEELARKAWGARWKGQRQKWLVMLFKGDEAEINLAGDHPEFNTWRWVPVQELTELAVSFKRQLYLNVIGEFATIFRD
jgi:putative (di)nucleoside polyphosphate hydrolase